MFKAFPKRKLFSKTTSISSCLFQVPAKRMCTLGKASDHLLSNEFFKLVRQSKYNQIQPTHLKSVVDLLEAKDRGNISRVVTLIESLNLSHRHKADEILRLLFQKYKQKHDNLPLDQTLPTFRIGI